MNRSTIFICILASAWAQAQQADLDALFPLPNFKKVIDTGMRIYSDLLILEEKTQRHERSEELMDLIIGRLVRLQSYVKTLINDYYVTRTVTSEELEYLARLLEYMQVTAEPLVNEKFPTLFNVWIDRLKTDLQNALKSAYL